MSDGNPNNERPLDQSETWIMRVGFTLIATTMVLGLIQVYKNQ